MILLGFCKNTKQTYLIDRFPRPTITSYKFTKGGERENAIIFHIGEESNGVLRFVENLFPVSRGIEEKGTIHSVNLPLTCIEKWHSARFPAASEAT